MTENVDWISNTPHNKLIAAAVAMHEMFSSLTAAGFTEQQALYLTAQMVTHRPKGGET